MRFLLWSLSACLFCSFAQDPVVITIDGKPFKKSELDGMIRTLPPQVQQNFSTNKKAFIETYALMVKLTQLAEKNGLDKKEPHATRLLYNRMQYLATAQLADEDGKGIPPEESLKYFADHKANYSEYRTKVLYVAFNNNPMASTDPKAKKPLNEAEAKEKAAGLLKQARAGSDFAKLIAENSDDAESKAKAGDFPPIKATDTSLPATLKSAVVALKPGEFTEVIQQPNGFYIFRLEEAKAPSFDDVARDVVLDMQKERLDQWVNGIRKSLSIQFNDEKYLTEPFQK